MKPEIYFLITTIALAILLVSLIGKCILDKKNDVKIKENDKNIIVKQYDMNVLISKNLKTFKTTYKTTFRKYKQNEILCDGILTYTQHSPHIVLVKTTKRQKKGNTTYKITKNEHMEKYFSCSQVEEFENKIGKRIIITKTYYPKEKIYYKFP